MGKTGTVGGRLLPTGPPVPKPARWLRGLPLAAAREYSRADSVGKKSHPAFPAPQAGWRTRWLRRRTISESSRGILANKHRRLRLSSCKSALIVTGIQLFLQKLSKSKQIRSRRGGETGEKPRGPYLHIVSLRLYSLACRCICRILVCFGISHRYDSHL